MECHECHLLDSSSVAQLFSVQAFAWLESHPCFAFDGLSRLLLRLVHSHVIRLTLTR